MFTGAIQEIGTLAGKKGHTYFLQTSRELIKDVELGGSISVNGACLTAVDIDKEEGLVGVEVSPETLSKTNLGDLKVKDQINLELPLEVNGDHGLLDGHIVQGHVDTVGRVVGITRKQNSYIYRYSVPDKFSPNLVEKGSIAIDGISLTVFQVKGGSFATTLIPYTYNNTVIQHRRTGSEVNVEFDILGKYVLNR